jgi:hypothetical protein
MLRSLPTSLVLACGLTLAAPQAGTAQPRPDLQVGGALDLPLPPLQAARQIRSDLLAVLARLRGIEGLVLGVDESGWIGLGWRTTAGDRDWLRGFVWDGLLLPGRAAGRLGGVLDLAPEAVRLELEGARDLDLIRLGRSGRQWQLALEAQLDARFALVPVERTDALGLVDLAEVGLSLPLRLDLGPLGLRTELVQMGWGSEMELLLAPEPEDLQLWYEAPLAERSIAGLGVGGGAGARLGGDDDTELHTSLMLSRAFARTGAAISAEAGLDLRVPETLWGPPEGSLRIAAGAGAPLGTGRRLHLGFEYLQRDLLGPDGAPERGFSLRLVL